MTVHDTQSFFTPDEFFCQSSRLLSKTYNLAHILLKRSQSSHLFIPIRTLQYLAIIENDIFWFVDSLAYAVRGDEGGRLIRISWKPVIKNAQRNDLTQHMDCRVIFYGTDMSEIQNRLNSEFYQAMLLIDKRYRDTLVADYKVNIVSLKPPSK
ncbi:MAG: hypothetical protein ACC653_09675 [Gammaproteobacteria bacterium]